LEVEKGRIRLKMSPNTKNVLINIRTRNKNDPLCRGSGRLQRFVRQRRGNEESLQLKGQLLSKGYDKRSESRRNSDDDHLDEDNDDGKSRTI